jgi:hypothetical protein
MNDAAFSVDTNVLFVTDFQRITGKQFVDNQGKFATKERLGVIEPVGLPIEVEWDSNDEHVSNHKVLSGWTIAAMDAYVLEENEERLRVLLPTDEKHTLKKLDENNGRMVNLLVS